MVQVVAYRTSAPQVRVLFPGWASLTQLFIPTAVGRLMSPSLLGDLTLGVLLQTNHLIGTSAHAPQHSMVTCTGIDTVGPGPHGLLRH
ncbi:hypothetical protein TNCV_1854011 [Trichonephila clavipes]|nr:hypothetical protein TNCV_1854011 [Trichonephila clavipes]